MANITVKEKQYLLSEGDRASAYEYTVWENKFADNVYKDTIERLETIKEPLTFEDFFEELVMPNFFMFAREGLVEDNLNVSDSDLIKEALESASYSDEVDEDEDSNIETREEALDLLARMMSMEQTHLLYQEAKLFLDEVGIYALNDELDEFDEDINVFNDPNNVLFHSEDKTFFHYILHGEKPRRVRLCNLGDGDLSSEYRQFEGKLDSRGQITIKYNPYWGRY